MGGAHFEADLQTFAAISSKSKIGRVNDMDIDEKNSIDEDMQYAKDILRQAIATLDKIPSQKAQLAAAHLSLAIEYMD